MNNNMPETFTVEKKEKKIYKLQNRYDTALNWSTQNPVLLMGEYGIVSDSPQHEYRVGDGRTHWNALPPFYQYDGSSNMKSIKQTLRDVQIEPNTYNKWGKVDFLNITLAPEIPDVVNIYAFQFESGMEPTELHLPKSLKWANGKDIKIKANEIYEFIIHDGLVSGGIFK